MTGEKRDLTGQSFGRWTVLYETEPYIDKKEKKLRKWHCRCNCADQTERDVLEKSLVSGRSKSCGCLQKEYYQKSERKLTNDLTGQRFGRLLVESRAPNNNGHVMWNCRCDCGNFCTASGDLLKSGHKQSCGCLAHDMLIQRNKSLKGYNEYDLTEEYGIGYTSKGVKFLFDKEDYDKIYPYRWNVNALNYITCHDEDHNRKTLFLHRVVMDVEDCDWKEIQIDHINGNVLDNRKSNLRIVDPSHNGFNKKLLSNNTSGTSGVSYNKNLRKWVVRINPQPNKRIVVGVFENYYDAVKARKEAENKYYGEYSYDNSRMIDKGD